MSTEAARREARRRHNPADREDDVQCTVADVAKILEDVTTDGVRWLERTGELPSTRTLSGQRLFWRSDVLALRARRDAAAAAHIRGKR
jgi:hypothetical protein